jgi:fucose permease
MHSALGLGLMGGPLLAGLYTDLNLWIGFPLTLLGAGALLMVLAVPARFPARFPAGAAGPDAESRGVAVRAPRFWLFMGVAVLYAFAEGTFSNWVVIYLQGSKGLSMATAALGLSVFWGALVVGRLAASALVLRVAPERIWLTLPVLMIGAFLLLPHASGAMLGVGLFGLAGLACSAFFPLTIALASRQFAGEVPWVSSMLTAALMIGVGVGSFIVGPLREWLALERLYQVSAIYPLAALIVGATLVYTRRPAASAA